MIDADPQGSLTISLGFHESDQMEYSLATAMIKLINDEPVMVIILVIFPAGKDSRITV